MAGIEHPVPEGIGNSKTSIRVPEMMFHMIFLQLGQDR